MTDRPHFPTGSLNRRIIGLAWPVLAQQALLFCVGIYDRFLAGQNELPDRALHVATQAAQTNAGYLLWFVSNLTLLVSVGSTALVARFVGARSRDEANRALHQSILLAAVLGSVASVLGFLLIGPLIGLLGLHGDAANSAVEFLQPVLGLVMFQLVESAGVACLIGAGDTRTGPLVSGTVALLNIPLAWALFHGFGPLPALGFRGIGCGTAMSHVVGCLVVLTVLARGRFGLKLQLAGFKPHFHTMYRLLRVSVPAAVDGLSVCAGQFWFLSLVNQIGDESTRNFTIAAHGHAIQWEAMGYLSGFAFGVAAMTLVGQNLGALRPAEAARAGWAALRLGGVFMCLMGAIFFVFAPQMLHLFSPGEHQRPVIALGIPVLRLVAFAMPALACTNVFTAALRGAGDTRWPVLITWIGFLGIRIPLAYFFTNDRLDLGPLGALPGWNLGLFGAWLAMFADLYVRGGLFVARFARGKWKEIKV